MKYRRFARHSAAGILLVACLPLVSEASDWNYSAELYALAAGVSGTTASDKDVEADFGDILDNLKFGVMGSLAARRDKLTLFANLFYANLEASERSSRGPVTTTTDAEVESLVSTLGAGWALYTSDNWTFNGVVGARYLSMDADIRLQTEPLGRQRSSSLSPSYWDGVLGIQGRADLSDRWYLNYYADAGTGESDLTWQAKASLNYRFNSLDVSAGYQYLAWEFDDQLLDDLEIGGPTLGVKFHW